MYELVILSILIICFVGLSYYFTTYDFSTYSEYNDETLNYNYSNTDIVIMVSFIILITIVVICIIFNDRFINYLKTGSKLSGLGYSLAKIKSWFVPAGGFGKPVEIREPRTIMTGGGRGAPMPASNYMAEDDMPYSSDEDEDY